MLNYIWAGLIIFSLVFALAYDYLELRNDRYRNRQPIPVTLIFPNTYDPDAATQTVRVVIDPDTFRRHFRTDAAPDQPYTAALSQTNDITQLRFARGQTFPEPLDTIRHVQAGDDRDLPAGIATLAVSDDGSAATASIRFQPTPSPSNFEHSIIDRHSSFQKRLLLRIPRPQPIDPTRLTPHIDQRHP